jgi:hypothetical protein
MRVIQAHLGSPQVARVIYGAIIGLALVVALEKSPPAAGFVAGSLLATALAVGLAEVYSEVVGTETRTGRRVRSDELQRSAADALAVAFGIGFPAVFFLLAVVDVIETDVAFSLAVWTGAALIGFYGFWAARLAGAGLPVAVLQALAVSGIGALLIALKALLH